MWNVVISSERRAEGSGGACKPMRGGEERGKEGREGVREKGRTRGKRSLPHKKTIDKTYENKTAKTLMSCWSSF